MQFVFVSAIDSYNYEGEWTVGIISAGLQPKQVKPLKTTQGLFVEQELMVGERVPK